jgi:hypothetical protein
MQHKQNWQYSPRRIINAINSLKAKEYGQGYYETEANSDAVGILEQSGIDWSKNLQSLESINRLSKIKK